MRRVLDAMDGHIIPNSHMIDDGEGTYQALVVGKRLIREVQLSLETIGYYRIMSKKRRKGYVKTFFFLRTTNNYRKSNRAECILLL